MIDLEAKYQFIFLSISFRNNLPFLRQLKENFPVEIPFIDFENISEDMKESLDSYIYIKNSETFKRTFEALIDKFPQITWTHLGTVPGSEICRFIDTCESKVSDAIQINRFYRVLSGPQKGLVLKAKGIEDNEFIGFYETLGEKTEVRVSIGGVELVPDYPYENLESQFTNFIKKAQDMGHKKAIIIDGDHILYRNMFGYDKMYTTRTRKFVGGSFGFYFTLLKLKELFVEYEIHVVFDGYPAEKYGDNPNYKAGRMEKSPKFSAAFKENQQWIIRLVQGIGFNLYLLPDQEADDVIGSLAYSMINKLEYEQVLIYATDNDFYQLVNSQINIYQPKISFRGHSELIGEEEVLKKYKVGEIRKINWYRAIKGDVSDNIPSINTYYSDIGHDTFVIKGSDYVPIIKKAESLEALRECLRQNDKFTKFIEDGKFDKNLELLTLNTEINLIPLADYGHNFDNDTCRALLEENCFYKELEMWDKNSRILRGIW